MKNRYFIIYGLLIAGLFLLWGCNKETNIVAPSGSTITVSAIPGTTVVAGNSVMVSAVVKDSNGNAMNGVGVRYTSSKPSVASFSGGTAQITQATDTSGVATITVSTFATKIGSADITADIAGVSGSVTLKVE